MSIQASSFPSVVVYVMDTSRSTNPVTFMSNMLYACRQEALSHFPYISSFSLWDKGLWFLKKILMQFLFSQTFYLHAPTAFPAQTFTVFNWFISGFLNKNVNHLTTDDLEKYIINLKARENLSIRTRKVDFKGGGVLLRECAVPKSSYFWSCRRIWQKKKKKV